jgi:uncharacterized surface protein with fasciclin (FAS1) repeats
MRRCLTVLLCALFLGLNVFPAAAQDSLPTLAQQIAARDDLSLFQQLLTLGDPSVRAWLENPANRFTVFAPTDAAWQQYFDDFGDSFAALIRGPNRLDDLLRYHIVPVTVAPQDIFSVYCTDLGTMLPDSRLVLHQEQGALFVNDYQDFGALGTPIAAANGVLYPVDHVLLRYTLFPQSGDHTPDDVIKPTVVPDPPLYPVGVGADVRTVLEQDGHFSTLLSLLADFPPYQDLVSGDGLYMLVAPTDATFERYFRASGLTLETFRVDYGAAFAAYSLWPGYFFPATFQEYAFYHPSFCSFDLMGSTLLEAIGESSWNMDGVPYTGAVLFARNAVIYVIDGVRLPKPKFMG